MGVKKKKKNVTLLNVKGDHRREKLLKEKVRERERERGDSLSKTNSGDSVSETQRKLRNEVSDDLIKRLLP